MSVTSNSAVPIEQEVAQLPKNESATADFRQSKVSRLLLSVKEWPGRARELLAYLVVFLLIYSVCYAIPYGFLDDYTFLYSGETKTIAGQFALSVENGRPILAYLFEWTFSAMHGLSDLRYLRVISIIGIALCAWLVYLALRRAGLTYWQAFLIPIVIFSLPGYQVLAAWSVCAYFSYAALLAGGALLLTERAFALRYSERFLASPNAGHHNGTGFIDDLSTGGHDVLVFCGYHAVSAENQFG